MKGWKRFGNIERATAVFLMVALLLKFFEQDLLDKPSIPPIIDYLFWFSLGIYLGFLLCKTEFIKANNQSQKTNMGN